MNLFKSKKLALRVSLMRQKDIAQVAEIDRESFPTMMPPTNFKRELDNSLAHYIVASSNGKMIDEPGTEEAGHYILGFAGFWIMSGEAHIVNIAVRQAYRHRGIGKLLLISLLDRAVKMKAHLVTLEVRASNGAAQNLYQKYGFIITGLRRGYYSDDKEDAIIMTLDNIDSVSFQEQLKRLKKVRSGKLVI